MSNGDIFYAVFIYIVKYYFFEYVEHNNVNNPL